MTKKTSDISLLYTILVPLNLQHVYSTKVSFPFRSSFCKESWKHNLFSRAELLLLSRTKAYNLLRLHGTDERRLCTEIVMICLSLTEVKFKKHSVCWTMMSFHSIVFNCPWPWYHGLFTSYWLINDLSWFTEWYHKWLVMCKTMWRNGLRRK
jgi:hypothetical protein